MQLIVKKTISALALPIPISLFLLIVGLITLFICANTLIPKLLISLATLLFILFSTPLLPNFLLKQLETQYKPLTILAPNIHTIVVLGAGNGGESHYPANSQLSSASLARLIEGIRIQNISKNIIREHGGQMELDVQNINTTFHLRFPQYQANQMKVTG